MCASWRVSQTEGKNLRLETPRGSDSLKHLLTLSPINPGEANLTSNSVTLLLSLLSASLGNGTALPPYLSAPEPYLWSQKLEQLDSDILSIRHIAEPGYASFAVIQLGTTGLIDDLRDVLAIVKGLVGELDFSFHVVSTSDLSRHDTEETVVYRPVRSKQD